MTGPGRVVVGYVRRAHGIRGDVLVRPQTDDPDRFAPGARFETTATPPRTLEVAAGRRHGDDVIVAFVGISTRDEAEELRGSELTIDRTRRRRLEHDEYWPDDLEGLEAVTPDGEVLGRVTGVEFGVAQDRLVVLTSSGDHVEVPFVEAIVGDVDLDGGRMVIDAPPGLFDDDAASRR